jgi:phosphoglycolate phosphatase
LLKVDYKNILYIGDSEVDIRTVENVGCQGAYVSYGFRSKEELISNGGKNIFNSPFELLDWLRG